VAEVLAENGLPVKLLRLGIADGEYAIAGDRASTRACHGIDASSVAAQALRLCTGG
jgi:transketolase